MQRVILEPRMDIGSVSELPIGRFAQGDARRMYDITPDGRRFLMMVP